MDAHLIIDDASSQLNSCFRCWVVDLIITPYFRMWISPLFLDILSRIEISSFILRTTYFKVIWI
jgi:hypothetical protein